MACKTHPSWAVGKCQGTCRCVNFPQFRRVNFRERALPVFGRRYDGIILMNYVAMRGSGCARSAIGAGFAKQLEEFLLMVTICNLHRTSRKWHLATNYTHMGPVGAGQTTKLINQVPCGSNFLAVAEATHLALNAGVDAAKIPISLKMAVLTALFFKNICHAL
jgi:hypothetical protein